MKIIKTYTLSEKTLEKDIDRFIRDAKRGLYQYDYKHGMEGLKIIKAYFRILQEEFDRQNYTVCQACYKKLVFLLVHRDYDYFNYEDIIDRSKLDFEKIIFNYFACLTKLCTLKELFGEYIEYLKVKGEPDYDFADIALIRLLSKKQLNEFSKMVAQTAETVKEEDYALHDTIYFLLALAKHQNYKKEYYHLCQKYSNILGEEQKEEFAVR